MPSHWDVVRSRNCVGNMEVEKRFLADGCKSVREGENLRRVRCRSPKQKLLCTEWKLSIAA
jgi:hypothetical protein